MNPRVITDFERGNKVEGSVLWIWDATAVTNTGSTNPITGAYRVVTPADFANISLTGANLSIDNVAVTGGLVGITGDLSNAPASSSTIYPIVSSGVAQLWVSGNVNRVGLFLFNNSTEDAFIKFGSGVSMTNFSFILGPSGSFEMQKRYTSDSIYAIWRSSTTGSGLATELT